MPLDNKQNTFSNSWFTTNPNIVSICLLLLNSEPAQNTVSSTFKVDLSTISICCLAAYERKTALYTNRVTLP